MRRQWLQHVLCACETFLFPINTHVRIDLVTEECPKFCLATLSTCYIQRGDPIRGISRKLQESGLCTGQVDP
jgi:hypothetical protein